MDPITGSSESFPIWITSMLLFGLIFLALAARVVVREVWKMRREGFSHLKDDVHIYSVPGLGTTMADGGRPAGKRREKRD